MAKAVHLWSQSGLKRKKEVDTGTSLGVSNLLSIPDRVSKKKIVKNVELHTHTYMHTHAERERKRERDWETENIAWLNW